MVTAKMTNGVGLTEASEPLQKKCSHGLPHWNHSVSLAEKESLPWNVIANRPMDERVNLSRLSSPLNCFPRLSITFLPSQFLSSLLNCFPRLSIAFIASQLLCPPLNCFARLSIALLTSQLLCSPLNCFPPLSIAFLASQLFSSPLNCFSRLSIAFLVSQLFFSPLNCFARLSIVFIASQLLCSPLNSFPRLSIALWPILMRLMLVSEILQFLYFVVAAFIACSRANGPDESRNGA
jgi:hypothetical protein